MTLFALLMRLSGLSQREAAAFLEVSPGSVDAWSRGRRTAPDGALSEMRALIARQQHAAEEKLGVIAAEAAARIQIDYPSDDHEAQSLGWPCVGAWRGMAARVVAGVPDASCLDLAPRGSTPATTAASDMHDTRL